MSNLLQSVFFLSRLGYSINFLCWLDYSRLPKHPTTDKGFRKKNKIIQSIFPHIFACLSIWLSILYEVILNIYFCTQTVAIENTYIYQAKANNPAKSNNYQIP